VSGGPSGKVLYSLTIYSRRDLAPPRRHRRTGRRVLISLLVIVVLAGGGYAAWRFTRSGSGTQQAAQTHRCFTPAAAPAPVPSKHVRLRVMNTTLRTGLAAKVRTELRRRGFRVVGIGNASPRVKGVVIRYPGAGGTPSGAVITLREQFPDAVLRAGGRKGSYEIDLGTGFRRPAAPHAAAAARAADERAAHPSPTCASPSA
jgi:hypothetical protein